LSRVMVVSCGGAGLCVATGLSAGRLEPPVVGGWGRDRDRVGRHGHPARRGGARGAKLADETGLAIQVCHFPPGTSKWNKIEHRLFSFVSKNWRGKPLTRLEVIINLIGAATTRTGLEVYARLDQNTYPKGIKISDKQLAAVNLTGATFHPDWNYTVNKSPIYA